MSARLSGSYLLDQPLLRLISVWRAIDPVMIGGTEFAHEEAGFLLLGHVLAVVAGLVDQRVLVVLRGVVRLVHRPVGFWPGCRGLGVGRGVGARRLDGHGGPGLLRHSGPGLHGHGGPEARWRIGRWRSGSARSAGPAARGSRGGAPRGCQGRGPLLRHRRLRGVRRRPDAEVGGGHGADRRECAAQYRHGLSGARGPAFDNPEGRRTSDDSVTRDNDQQTGPRPGSLQGVFARIELAPRAPTIWSSDSKGIVCHMIPPESELE